MPIIPIILTLALVGFLLWVLFRFVPMKSPFPEVIIGIVCVLLILWILQLFGVNTGLPPMTVK